MIIKLQNNRVSFPPAWFGQAGANDNADALNGGPCAGLRTFCKAVGVPDATLAEIAFLMASSGADAASSAAAQQAFYTMMQRPQVARGDVVAAITLGAFAGLAKSLGGLLDDLRASGDSRHVEFAQHLLDKLMAQPVGGQVAAENLL